MFCAAGMSGTYVGSCPGQLTFERQQTPIHKMPNTKTKEMPRDSSVSKNAELEHNGPHDDSLNEGISYDYG